MSHVLPDFIWTQLTYIQLQLYTMLFMGLLPLPAKIQFEVIPYVRTFLLPSVATIALSLLILIHFTASILGSHLLRRIPPRKARLRSPHIQRRTRSTRGIDGTDSRGEERLEEEGRRCGLAGHGLKRTVLLVRLRDRRAYTYSQKTFSEDNTAARQGREKCLRRSSRTMGKVGKSADLRT